MNNLRQIGIAFQAWGTDHEDRRPWFVPMNEGVTHSHPLRNEVFIHYTPLSNYLSSGILMDPAEALTFKRRADNWGTGAGGIQNPGFRNNAVSYMIGADAYAAAPHVILGADRHIAFDYTNACPSAGGLQVLSLGIPWSVAAGWTNGIHGVAGNVLFNDGRVEFAEQTRLRAIVRWKEDAGAHHMLVPE